MNPCSEDTLVSVVIPVYNVREYLDTCLESVCGQTYRRMQIILVDDGSTDGCGDACERWALSDARIEVVHSVNSGLSAARNLGMESVEGDYVLFVDSDDMLGPKHVEHLLRTTLGSDNPEATVSVTGFTAVGESAPMEVRNGVENVHASPIETAEAISASVTVGERFAAHAWGKLYPKSLFPLLRYPVGRFYEDQYVTYKVFLGADCIIYEDADDYLYRVGRPGSISVGERARNLDYLDAIRETLLCVRDVCPDSVPSVEARYLGALVGGIETARVAGMPERYTSLFEEARGMNGAAHGCGNLARTDAIRFALLRLGPSVYGRAIDLKAFVQSFPSRVAGKLARARAERAEGLRVLAALRDRVGEAHGPIAFLAMTPRYRNYGDHLIAFSERRSCTKY